jgi:CRP-like cAMP-binding protein
MEPLITKLAIRDPLTPKERDRLAALAARVKDYAPGDEIVPEETPIDFSTLMLQGVGCRQKVFQDGRRQIVAFHVPGDFCDLHSYLLKRMEHGVAALSPCQVAQVPHDRLRRITDEEPHLTRLLWISTLIDAAIYREWIISLGRRSAFSRLAHLFCELFVRLRAVGLTETFEYALPVTQSDLSDAMGISLVHTNRTLAQLRRKRLVTFANRMVTIHDWNALQRAAEFDPAYLHLSTPAAS